MSISYDLGVAGEKKALAFLQKMNYKILAQRWHFGKAELDIVAWHENTLHSIEVKTRMAGYILNPLEAITPKKQKLWIMATQEYIATHDLDCDTQFDIIVVIKKDNTWDIDWIPDAFRCL